MVTLFAKIMMSEVFRSSSKKLQELGEVTSMTQNEAILENGAAERVFRRGDDSAILRMSESEIQAYKPLDDRRMVVNMGPQHPSTHGVLRLSLEMEGETVLRSKPIIGYLHTGMEKTGEQLSYLQGATNVTRMDYSSPLFSELAFSLATAVSYTHLTLPTILRV